MLRQKFVFSISMESRENHSSRKEVLMSDLAENFNIAVVHGVQFILKFLAFFSYH